MLGEQLANSRQSAALGNLVNERVVTKSDNSVRLPVKFPQLKKHFHDIRNANEAGQPLADLWASFVSVALASEVSPPVHLQLILSILKEAGRGRSRDALVVFDHGCGGGFTLLYLFALGIPVLTRPRHVRISTGVK